jgi:hypothetical protein
MQVRNRITVADIMRSFRAPVLNDDGSAKIEDGKPVLAKLDLTDKPLQLYVVYGKAKTSKSGTSQYGDYVEYFGAFEARRVADGEVFQAGRVIFPPPTDAVVDNAFNAAKAEDASAEVAFAFVIGSEPFVRGEEAKFRYTCEPVQVGDLPQFDPLADIKAALSAKIPALLPPPATASAALEAPAPETAAEGGKAKK